MRRLLCLLLLAVLVAAPVQAAERVLLAPPDTARGLSAAASAAGSLTALRQAATRAGKTRVIVGLRVPFAAEMALAPGERALQRSEIASAGIGLRARFSAAVARNPGAVRSYSAIPFMALEVSAAELERLARDPDVISLAPDAMIPLALKESTRLVHAPDAWAMGFSGLGQTVAVIDTGVDKTHPYLAGKVVSEACYSQGGFCPGDNATSSTAPGSGMPCPLPDYCYHGTHVAGIAAGKDTLFSGVARDANLIAIQVFSPYYGIAAANSDILAGLNRVYDLRDAYKIAAVNLSLGGDQFASACDTSLPAVFAAFANLRAAGIAPVVASGNDGSTDSLGWPSCYSNAVSVGAVSDEAWGPCGGAATAVDKVACFSNTAPFLSLLAPGALITSAVPGGGIRTLMGTSMAAPHVAGAFAVLRQRFPDASVSDLLARLQTSGRQVSDYRVPAIVKSRIDVAAALGATPVRLSYVKAGPGAGSVSFAPASGSPTCNASCVQTFAPGTRVTVTAQSAAGSAFAGWNGACSGLGACTFTMDSAKQLTANFTRPVQMVSLNYQKTGDGAGSVTLASAADTASCAASCMRMYRAGTVVTLTPQPTAASVFQSWTGACTGSGTCTITLTGPASVTAVFVRQPQLTLTYTKLGKGQGSVSFAPAGGAAACSGNCVQRYGAGTRVKLTANPARNMKFTGWSGACTGTGACSFTMTAARTVGATFAPR